MDRDQDPIGKNQLVPLIEGTKWQIPVSSSGLFFRFRGSTFLSFLSENKLSASVVGIVLVPEV